jgi:hypothetical protein
MYGGEPLVPRAYRTATPLFEMIEKATEHLSRKVDYLKTINRGLFPGACKWKKESEGIPIAPLRVPAEVAF